MLDPGGAGWVGLGFAELARTPLPASGQVWVALNAGGRLTVRAAGSRYLLYQRGQPHPAFQPGPNRVRLQYDRVTNRVRLWLNRVEVELDHPDLDVFGFVPSIQVAGFQGHFQGAGQKSGGAEILGFSVELGEEDLADSFTTGVAPRLVGAPLDGVPVEVGGVTWSATSSVCFGKESLTNADSASEPRAGVPFNPAEHPGYRTAAVEAVTQPDGAGGWFGIGFASVPTGAFWNSGQVWLMLRPDGVVQVMADGAAHTLFNAPVNPTLPARLKLEYDRLTNGVRAWVNSTELELTASLGEFGYTPAITHAAFHRFVN